MEDKDNEIKKLRDEKLHLKTAELARLKREIAELKISIHNQNMIIQDMVPCSDIFISRCCPFGFNNF